jgi:hypothetical protein
MRGFDLTGQIFGRLTVISRSVRDKNGFRTWLCRCECDGNERTYRVDALRFGKAKSCGCQRSITAIERSVNVVHGHKAKGKISAEYRCWCKLRDRCNNPKNQDWVHYGFRGIKVCDRWMESFENFFADMGTKPTPKHSIDRINVDGNYEPSNCRWATHTQQMNNIRRNIAVLLYLPAPTYYSVH